MLLRGLFRPPRRIHGSFGFDSNWLPMLSSFLIFSSYLRWRACSLIVFVLSPAILSPIALNRTAFTPSAAALNSATNEPQAILEALSLTIRPHFANALSAIKLKCSGRNFRTEKLVFLLIYQPIRFFMLSQLCGRRSLSSQQNPSSQRDRFRPALAATGFVLIER